MALFILRAAVTVLCQLSEISSFLNPWLYDLVPHSSSTKTKAQSGRDELRAALSCTVYAVLEPLFTLAILRWGIQPAILLHSFNPTHLGAAMLSNLLYTHVMLAASPQPPTPVAHSAGPVKTTAATTAMDSVDSATISDVRVRLTQARVALALLPSTVTAAVSNGTLLLLAQSLSITTPSAVTQILAVVAIAVNLCCRFADYKLCENLRPRLLPLDRRSGGRAKTVKIIACLTLLFTVRLCVRAAIGIDPFLAFRTLDQVKLEALYGPDSSHREIWAFVEPKIF